MNSACEPCGIEKETIPGLTPKGHPGGPDRLRCPQCANWKDERILCSCGVFSSPWPKGTLSCARCQFSNKHGIPR